MLDALAAFAPDSPDFIRDPYPALRALRESGPIHFHGERNLWLVTRHSDVNAILRDRRFGRSCLHVATHEEMGRTPEPAWQAPFWQVVRNGMLDREPPDHTRLRALGSKAFRSKFSAATLRPGVQKRVDALLDDALKRETFDLLADFFEPLPVAVIADVLGIPEEDRPKLRPWSADMCVMYELGAGEALGRRAVRAAEEFEAYLRRLVAERRARPRTDLVSELLHVEENGARLTDDEVIGHSILMLNAGHEASVNGAGNGWWALFRHPEALAWLREDPVERSTRAVEELLRFDTPLPIFERWVLEDAEVCGVRVPRGAELGLLFASANRDPAAFTDPDRLDLARDPNHHLAFGAGIHFCLGAPLARAEMQVAFETLLRRAPTLQLVEEPEWKPTFVLRGLKELRVRT